MAQLEEYGRSNNQIMGLIPRKCTYSKKVSQHRFVTYWQILLCHYLQCGSVFWLLEQLYIAIGFLQTSRKILLRAGVHVQGNAYRASLHHTLTERIRAYTHHLRACVCVSAETCNGFTPVPPKTHTAELNMNQLNHPHNKTSRLPYVCVRMCMYCMYISI